MKTDGQNNQPQPDRAYTIKELVALKDEWLETLLTTQDSWYTSEHEVYNDSIKEFLKWLNTKENTP